MKLVKYGQQVLGLQELSGYTTEDLLLSPAICVISLNFLRCPEGNRGSNEFCSQVIILFTG